MGWIESETWKIGRGGGEPQFLTSAAEWKALTSDVTKDNAIGAGRAFQFETPSGPCPCPHTRGRNRHELRRVAPPVTEAVAAARSHTSTHFSPRAGFFLPPVWPISLQKLLFFVF